MNLQAEKKTPQLLAPHRTELIVSDGDGYRGYKPSLNDYFPNPIYNDKLNKGAIESRIVINKFSKAVNMIATLQNLTTLNKKMAQQKTYSC